MSDSKSNNKRLAKNTLFLYLRMIFVMVITLFTTRELLSVLGVEDYGVYNVVCGFVSMFSFLNTSMANGTQRFYNYAIGKNDVSRVAKIFTHSLIIQILISVVILVLIETIGLWYLFNEMVIPEGRMTAAFWIFQFVFIQLLFVMITVPYSAAVMAYEYMDFYALIGVVDAILKLLIVYVIKYASFDNLIFYGALMCAITIFDFFLNMIFCHRKITDIKIEKNIDKELFRDILSFSGWNVFGSVSHMMQGQGVNLILNAFWGTIINAANGIASQISGAVSSLTAALVTAVRPQMIKSYASGENEYLLKMYYSVSKLTFFLVMAITVPLIGEIKTILDIWLGSGSYPDVTIIFTQITMLIVLCGSFATPSSIIVHATGKMKEFQIIVSLVTLTIIPVAYIAGKLGCDSPVILLLSAIVTLLAQLARLIVIKRIVNYPITTYCRKVLFPTFSVLLISLFFTLVLHNMFTCDITHSLLKILFSGCFSLCLIYVIGLNASEKNLIKSFLKNN